MQSYWQRNIQNIQTGKLVCSVCSWKNNYNNATGHWDLEQSNFTYVATPYFSLSQASCCHKLQDCRLAYELSKALTAALSSNRKKEKVYWQTIGFGCARAHQFIYGDWRNQDCGKQTLLRAIPTTVTVAGLRIPAASGFNYLLMLPRIAIPEHNCSFYHQVVAAFFLCELPDTVKQNMGLLMFQYRCWSHDGTGSSPENDAT